MVVKEKHAEFGDKGFSLLEVLIALAVLGVVLTGVVKMFTTTGRFHTSQERIVETMDNIRAVKQLMVDEVRSAGCNPKGKRTIGFINDAGGDERFDTDAESIHFTRDIDNGDNDQLYEPDGDAEDPNENIAYYRGTSSALSDILSATDPTPGILYRTSFGAAGVNSQPVADNITGLQFRYFDSLGTEIVNPTTTDLSKIKMVEVTIIGQVANTTQVTTANQTWTQRFRIRVRNL